MTAPDIVRTDHGGWVSGPSGTEPVTAAEIRAGDVIVYDDRRLVVTGQPLPAWWYEDGERIKGLAIATRAEGSRWCLYRASDQLVCRLRP